jgi:hypothetical protein
VYKSLNIWLPSYLRHKNWRKNPDNITDILLCVCDHFEPFHHADKAEALSRLELWNREYPKLIQNFHDADGQNPRHTFFYPIEQNDEDVLDRIEELCRRSGGEVEIHLHHENDTAEHTIEQLEKGKQDFVRHGFLSKDSSGQVRYGFIHGSWALDNSNPHGLYCGVSNELAVLRQTGCFADFTMPSLPSPTQTRIINSLYYAKGTPHPKSHDTGEIVRVRQKTAASVMRPEPGELLLVQGPLGLNWERRKKGIFPRIENGDLTGANPPTPDRIRLWTKLGIHVQDQPDWLFVKLHTHGAIPRNSKMLLGEPMRQFHQFLKDNYNEKTGFRIHYVSARELVNILHAAEDGHSGNPNGFRDYRYKRG